MEPYAYKWDRTHTANQLQDMYRHLGNGDESNSESDHVSIAGRIVARRAFGKLAFLTLRDDSGTIQVFTIYIVFWFKYRECGLRIYSIMVPFFLH